MQKAPASIVLGVFSLFMLGWCAVAQIAHGASDSHITGRVLSRSSTPIAAVWVVISENGTVRGRSLTGDDGRYYVGNLNRKGYDLAVMRGRQTTLVRRQVRLPENTTYDIVLPQ